MYDVTALGELLIDFSIVSADPEGYPTLKANPGGAPGNFLAALSRYGAKTALLAKVGDDVFGRLLVKTLKKEGVETLGVVRDPSVFTTLAFVTLSEEGERSFSFARKPGADVCLRKEELNLSLIDQAKMFHFGSLSLTGEPARTATREAVAYAKRRGKLISFDPNLRIPLWNDPDAAREQILWGLGQADVVKISGEEADFLWRCGEAEAAEKLMKESGAQLVMVTLGPRGCYLAGRNGAVSAACPPVSPVDTTGAGDIFGGSAVSRLLRAGKAPGDLSRAELEASLSTRKSGGINSIPDEDEVLKVIGQSA